MDKNELHLLLEPLRKIQDFFLEEYGVDDIWSNSKIYEIIIANQIEHELIPGHSGSKDAKDLQGNIYEYKHYKESSSNHTWTFNDYSDSTIESLSNIRSVVFAHIDDSGETEIFDWYYEVPGINIAEHLKGITKASRNTRKMWNVSHSQIENKLKINRTPADRKNNKNGKYFDQLNKIFKTRKKLESFTGVANILTSNKLWEVLVAAELNHKVNSEQGGRAGAHDAVDNDGNFYEYKVSKTYSWQFQDISENVLKKYLVDKKIILAVVDKTLLRVKEIFSAEPVLVVKLLNKKLSEKRNKGKEIRRLQVSLTKGDLSLINAQKLYKF